MATIKHFAGAGGGDSGGHIAANTLFSGSTLRVLDLISEGQIGGLVDGAKSIYFDDVPVQNSNGSYNFKNVEVDYVNGTADQKVLKNFGEVSTPKQVGGEAKYGFPVITAIDNAEVDKVRAVVVLPSLFSQDKKGNIEETSVKFRFELAVGNSGDWINLGEFTISGKQNSQYEKSYEFDLPQKDENGERPAQWLLKMTRLSRDSDERYSARTIFDTVYMISESKLNYPYSALVGIKVNAEDLQQVPTRSYLVDGMIIKIPSNYDPKTNTYDGIWDGTFKMSVSDNPAWILYAVLTNTRWGLGEFIKPEQINKARVYEIGRYCDELVDDGYGKKEKRFSINTQIQERTDAYRLVADIAAVFRGMTFWAGGMANFTCDMPTDASMLYTPANVIKGEFTYSSSSRNDRHSVALVTWNDPEQNYKQVVEYIEDGDLIGKYGIRQAEITAFGCTSRAQAIRVGKWILYTESYESDIISFNVALDSALVLPGDVIKIQDPSYAGKRLGGRIVSATETSVELDGPVSLTSSVEAIISLMMPSGSFVDRDVLVSFDGKRTRIEWNEPLEELPEPNAVWMITEASLVPQIARVVNIAQAEEPNTFTITAVSHEPKKFDLIEKGIEFVKDPTTGDPYDVQPPTNVNVEEMTNALGLGYVTSKLVVTWMGGLNCSSYELQWRRENENETDWETVITSSKSITLPDVQRGTYHFILTGVGLMGNRSESVEFYYKANGQYATPLDVTDFKVIKRPSYLEVRWSPVAEAFAYEVRCGASWDTSEVLIESFAGTSFVHYQYEAGDYYYHIRSISSTGQYSPNVTTFKLELRAPALPEDLAATVSQNRIDFTWKSNKEDDLSHYEMREGQSWDSGVKVAESKVNQMTIPGGSTAERKFWLKAIALPKIYSDEAAWISINIQNDETYNLILKHNAKTFNWPSNMVYMDRNGDDIAMRDGFTRGEYIHKMSLVDKITAQNSFFTSVAASVLSDDDTETWNSATWSWNSPEASRSWRLGGDAGQISHENQIARHVGCIHEFECITFDEHMNTEKNIAPTKQVGAKYEWGRYSKGLKIDDTCGAVWDTDFVSTDENGLYKFSTWIKTVTPEPNTTYTYFRFGNETNDLSLSYNTADKSWRLTSSSSSSSSSTDIMSIPMEMLDDKYVFVAVSQSETSRIFAIGVLGGDVQIQQSLYAPIGKIDYFKVGIESI